MRDIIGQTKIQTALTGGRQEIQLKAKTQLQEWLQQRSKPLPHYQLVEVGGQAHQRVFTVSCRIDEVANDMSASASSRRKAEQLVAELLLEELGKMR